MKIKYIYIPLMCIAFVVGGIYALIAINKYQDTQHVYKYLLQEGFEDSDIFSMTAKTGKGPFIRVWVIFSDEKEAKYPYAVLKKGVAQIPYALSTVQGVKPMFKHEKKENIEERLINEKIQEQRLKHIQEDQRKEQPHTKD